jgi:predicted alpha/beta superfamily hydrolase
MPDVQTVRVRYPLRSGRLVLRVEPDWETDVEPVDADPAAGRYEFRLALDRPFAYCKPVVRDGGAVHWSRGENYLLLPRGSAAREIHPFFFEEPGCSQCGLAERRSSEPGRTHRFRVFLPGGYHENELESFPVVFMQDGQNLFFPEESSGGAHWRVAETLALLDSMSLIRRVIVVGVYPQDRTRDYTSPGYEAYGRFLIEDLKAWIDATYRVLPGPEHTAVVGSSLGGVVSFYLAWQWPQQFGRAACLSSTFGWRDDLAERVVAEPRRDVCFYLDSGWPHDNYEVTRGMRDRLLGRGWAAGRDLLHLAYPEARHDERAWGSRLHVPLQFFFGDACVPEGRA